mmetsp:Transcript_8284/g.12755  ORF Transcript_8284/g.12755 Transcript_8284/m.12755 type:complete len:394 (-) Transcript_8284:34-1215(-)
MSNDSTSSTYNGGKPPSDAKKVVVSETAGDIPRNAFYFKSSLESIIFSNGSVIGEKAFDGCQNLANVEFPTTGLVTIESEAFFGCFSLKAIRLPAGLKTIGKKAFKNCRSLSIIELPGSVETIEEDVFENCIALKEIVIPDKVKKIARATFMGCTSLSSVAFPANLKEIGNNAFMSCTSLLKWDISDHVKVAASAFFGAGARIQPLKSTTDEPDKAESNKSMTGKGTDMSNKDTTTEDMRDSSPDATDETNTNEREDRAGMDVSTNDPADTDLSPDEVNVKDSMDQADKLPGDTSRKSNKSNSTVFKTKTVQLPADAFKVAFGKGPGGRPVVVDVDPSSKVTGMLNVGDIVVAFEENGRVTYNNLSLRNLAEKIKDSENNPLRKITVVESNYC